MNTISSRCASRWSRSSSPGSPIRWLVTGLAQVLFPAPANGSLVDDEEAPWSARS